MENGVNDIISVSGIYPIKQDLDGKSVRDFRSYTSYLFIRNLIFFETMKLTDKPLWITIQYICVLFLSVCLLGLIVSDLIFVWVIAIFFWLFILHLLLPAYHLSVR